MRLGYSLFDSLLEGKFTANPQSLERAARRGFDPDGRYRVALLVLDEPVPLSRKGFLRREQLASRVERQLRDLDQVPLLTVSLNQIILLLAADCPQSDVFDALADRSVGIALGRRHNGIAGIHRSYQEARTLVRWLRPGEQLTYDGMIVPRVLQGDPDARHDLFEELFGALRRHRHGELMIESLMMLARCGFHHGVTARRLCIHEKTLSYRLRRASSLAALDVTDPETRFRLQLAAQLNDHLLTPA